MSLVVGLEDANAGAPPKASKERAPVAVDDEPGLETAVRRRRIRGRSERDGFRSTIGVYGISIHLFVLLLRIGGSELCCA